MSSRFDYRDPGTDEAYCNGLRPDRKSQHLSPIYPQPKPPSRLQNLAVARLDRLSRARLFRAAVWARDKGICRYCGKRVKRTIELDPLRGEVHHLRGRYCAPADRYNVDAAVLVCLEHHGKLQRHEIEWQAAIGKSS